MTLNDATFGSFGREILISKVIHTDLLSGLWSWFISRSVQAILPASVYSASLFHSQASLDDRQTHSTV